MDNPIYNPQNEPLPPTPLSIPELPIEELIIPNNFYYWDGKSNNFSQGIIQARLEIDGIKNHKHSSESILTTGYLIKGNERLPVYCKWFKTTDNKLNYEKDIYTYIKQFVTSNPNIKETIEEHIIVPYEIHLIETKVLRLLLSNEQDDNFVDLCLTFEIYNNTPLIGIITPNYDNSLTLYYQFAKIFKKYDVSNYEAIYNEEKENVLIDNILTEINPFEITFIEMIFDLLYSFYLLHTQLDIMHNDNHFNNILYYDTDVKQKTYHLGQTKITTLTNSTIRLFDFDLSTKIRKHRNIASKNNTSLSSNNNHRCLKYGSCNAHSQKDVYVIIVSLYKWYKIIKHNNSLRNLIFSIILCLSDNNINLIKAIKYNTTTKPPTNNNFWSGYYTLEKDIHNNYTNRFITVENNFANNIITPPNYNGLEITTVMSRFIDEFCNKNLLLIRNKNDQGQYVYNTIEYIEPDALEEQINKKYLKYKRKYLELKRYNK